MWLNELTLASVVKVVAIILALEEGIQVHSSLVNIGFDSNIFVGSSLLHMYVKCWFLKEARHVFYYIPERNVLSWSEMIAIYALNVQDDESLKFFLQSFMMVLRPNDFTFSNVLSVCATSQCLIRARRFISSA